jgi:PKD domain
MAKAHHGPDAVLIGTGVFADGPFCYASSDPLVLIGEGRTDTLLTMTGSPASCVSGSPTAVLTLSNLGRQALEENGNVIPSHLRLTHLGVEIPNVKDALGNRLNAGLVLEGAFADDVAVTWDHRDPPIRPTGVVMQGIDAGLSTGLIDLPLDGSVGLRTEALATLIARSRITGATGVDITGNSLGSPPISPSVSFFSSIVTIAGAQPGAGGEQVGVLVSGIKGAPVDWQLLDAQNVTVYGSGRDEDIGLKLTTEPSSAALVIVASSIFDNLGISLERLAFGGVATLVSAFSSHTAPLAADGPVTGAPCFHPTLGDLCVGAPRGPPDFVDPQNGDFHLKGGPGSLIDRGDPLPLGRFESPVDFDGNPRVLDGTILPGDPGCRPIRDVGAYEFDPKVVLARVSVAPEAVAGRGAEFDASASCAPNENALLSYAWSFDDGTSASGARVLHTFTTPGEHKATVTVTSHEGYHASAAATVLVQAAQSRGRGAATEAESSTRSPNKAPRARRLDVRPHAFRAAAAGASIAPALPGARSRIGRSVGATVRYRLSEPAKIRFTVQRGVRRHRRMRFVTLRGAFVHAGSRQSNRFHFTGRLGGRKLRPGTYRLVGVPTDASGNRGKSVRAQFRIVDR